MKQSDVAEKFILHWGEMGTRWGINRTVAQIHALLFLSSEPLHADEITERLGVARSNVSTSLRELQSWGIVRVVHVRGDRRDHFESMKDVWEMFRIILDQRKKREWDPTLNVMRRLVAEADNDRSVDTGMRDRMSEMLKFFELMAAWYDSIGALSPESTKKLVKMGSRVGKLLQSKS
jgi:DNA-binding transcriptional regulator GbsR (MarR family)